MPPALRSSVKAWSQNLSKPFAADASGPVSEAVAKIYGVADALKKWDPKLAEVTEVVRVHEVPAVTDVSLGFTPQTWFFSYVTPTLGYATVFDNTSIATTTLQVYFVANSADEPMWRNGRADWWRVPSIELGLATKVTSFGPNDRYSGPGSLPPLLFGLGLQLLPYSVISGGMMLVDAKQTPLAAESAVTRVIPYLNFSVQINVPDIVSTLVSGKKSPAE